MMNVYLMWIYAKKKFKVLFLEKLLQKCQACFNCKVTEMQFKIHM